MYEETLSAAAHFTMFVPTLRSFGTDEQKAEWLTKAENCKILGSYVQTEVGHGTFVRGLETTAIYDPSTREFVLHSPAITAYKVSTSFHVDLKFISLHGIYAFYLISPVVARWTRSHCQLFCRHGSALLTRKISRTAIIYGAAS